MYLRECFIRNMGPIDSFQSNFPLAANGNPKPVIVVGQNGSGKTILLSFIVDALIEFAKTSFRNHNVTTPVHDLPSFRTNDSTNQKTESTYGLSLIRFGDETANLVYVDKTGTLDKIEFFQDFSALEHAFGSQSWPIEGNHKSIEAINVQVEDFFKQFTLCYFPTYRSETPHWLHKDAVRPKPPQPKFDLLKRISGRPIVVEHSAEANKNWLLDLFLDSLVDMDIVNENDNHTFTISDPVIEDKIIQKQARRNIDRILKTILQDENVSLKLNLRHTGNSRLEIAKNERPLIPSLDHLSTGQSLLFNLFVTIIRYADEQNMNNSVNLDQIAGIVMIDEVDAHLHSIFQHTVLPRLIKIFPRIQFIISTHSPLFLLGMENAFGQDGFVIVDMPTGEHISAERFSEFGRSYEYYSATKIFERDIKNRLSESQKPTLLTEGETDPKYIKTAMHLLGYSALMNKVNIEWVGSKDDKGNVTHTGKTALDQTLRVFVSNPQLLTRPLLLLYDCDTNKPAQDLQNISVRSVPLNSKNKMQTSGIENLLPETLFEEHFYKKQVKGDGYVVSLRKTAFCEYVCSKRKDPDDFLQFMSIIQFIQGFLDRNSSPVRIGRPRRHGQKG